MSKFEGLGPPSQTYQLNINSLCNYIKLTRLKIEMPQFINVLFGSMSVVGPRPHPVFLTDQYAKIVDKYMVRHFVKPGVTGLAQIKGYRGEVQDTDHMRNRIRLDKFYIENWSLLLDIEIVIKTFLISLKRNHKVY